MEPPLCLGSVFPDGCPACGGTLWGMEYTAAVNGKYVTSFDQTCNDCGAHYMSDPPPPYFSAPAPTASEGGADG